MKIVSLVASRQDGSKMAAVFEVKKEVPDENSWVVYSLRCSGRHGLVLFPPAGVRVAKAGAGCTLSTLDATYGFAVNGLVPTTNATAPHLGNFVPLAAGGTFTFDGSGNISRNFMLSFGGQIIPISDTGSYTINSNAPARLFFQL